MLGWSGYIFWTAPNKGETMRKRRKATNSDQLRFTVFSADNFRCRACGLYDQTGWNLQADHVQAEATHGTTTNPNDFQCLCGSCNNRKGTLSIGWLTKQPTMDLRQTVQQAIANRTALLAQFKVIVETAKRERAEAKRQARHTAKMQRLEEIRKRKIALKRSEGKRWGSTSLQC